MCKEGFNEFGALMNWARLDVKNIKKETQRLRQDEKLKRLRLFSLAVYIEKPWAKLLSSYVYS